MRKCSIELLWNIMLNVARDNNSKHAERMDGLSRCAAAAPLLSRAAAARAARIPAVLTRTQLAHGSLRPATLIRALTRD